MTMNQMIVRAVRGDGGRTPGGVARLAGGSRSAALRERLSSALNDLESARRAGDEEAVGFCEFRVDQAVEEARATRAPAEPEAPPPIFDGGVRRGPRPIVRPGMREDSAMELLARSFAQHSVEKRERNSYKETIITNDLPPRRDRL
jgi:hypothetical protein